MRLPASTFTEKIHNASQRRKGATKTTRIRRRPIVKTFTKYGLDKKPELDSKKAGENK